MKHHIQVSDIQMPNGSTMTVNGWESVGGLYRTQWGDLPVIANRWDTYDDTEDTPPDEHLGGH